MENAGTSLKKEQQTENTIRSLFRQWSARIGHRIANKLNSYTARWPPGTWKVALAVFCMICGGCCLWLVIRNFLS